MGSIDLGARNKGGDTRARVCDQKRDRTFLNLNFERRENDGKDDDEKGNDGVRGDLLCVSLVFLRGTYSNRSE